MNPDPEPVHAGPIQVYIMSGQPRVESAIFVAPHVLPQPGSACSWLRPRARPGL